MAFSLSHAFVTALLLIKSLASPSPFVKEARQDDGSGQPGYHVRDAIFREVVGSSEYGNHSKVPTPPGTPLKVGIIGAGVAGLYTAMLLDSLNITYDIYEASDRIGGRIYTHRFDQEAWDNSTPDEPAYYDYYDAGAMRFPPTHWMDRVIGAQNWSLISYINERVAGKDQVVQIPYIFTANNTFQLFNNVLAPIQDAATANRFNVTLLKDGVAVSTLNTGVASAIFTAQINSTGTLATLSTDFLKGFNQLMNVDTYSPRSYLLSKGFTTQEIDWMETVTSITGKFNTDSMTQSVMDQWIFEHADPGLQYTAINGGMDMITKGMTQIIKNKPIMNSRITAIQHDGAGPSLKITTDGGAPSYAHVVSTVPLGALQAIDMTELNLDYFRTSAIRSLNYDPATKIGFKFKSRWWEKLSSGAIQGGQSYTDLPIRRCVYPSYGVNVADAPGSMIASYALGQDAHRLDAYLNPLEPGGIEALVNLTLSNLASLHGVSFADLWDEFEDYHVQAWYQSEYTVGAFAMFGPGQYSSMMPYLMVPAADGHLHWAGDALSSGHGWIIGAVNSAWRTVMEILDTEGETELMTQFVAMWGNVNEVDKGWYNYVDPSVQV